MEGPVGAEFTGRLLRDSDVGPVAWRRPPPVLRGDTGAMPLEGKGDAPGDSMEGMGGLRCGNVRFFFILAMAAFFSSAI